MQSRQPKYFKAHRHERVYASVVTTAILTVESHTGHTGHTGDLISVIQQGIPGGKTP